ncbi:hypothetical protein HU755_05030 [Pseudomonas sp. SWRI111]|uniref:Uncharacterized protein n=1 Tax=Pseudomonas hamedanensis TaxID=2745504 RepID=A0A9E6NX12_9PSED|nr:MULTISPECIES: hypothetical protein [Pseudomonas]MBC3206141.1 hypothetical protein [Pseudomonas sp. SWRI111]QXI15708.1 hypothetical protein HU739_017515 [Pseudomonas hamedanensis]
MDTTDLQLRDYLQRLQVALINQQGGYRVVILEAGSDAREFERFVGRQFRLRLQHYMLTSRARALETSLAIVARSTHFLMYQRDQLVGVLRVTPSPFEWASLAQQYLSPTVALARHVEFSRLITHSQQHRSVPINGLLAVATEWAINRGYQGITALCRSPQRRMFQRFGLTPLPSTALHIEQRARGDYWLLAAQWREILAALQQPVALNANPSENCDEHVRQF